MPSRALLDSLGRVAPGFRVESEVGRGPFGIVYRGRQVRLDSPVAVKVIDPSYAGPDVRQRLVQLAPALAAIDHPHLVPLLDAVTTDDSVVLITGWTPESIDARLVRTGGSPLDATAAGVAAGLALGAAHAVGLSHHDLKPSNLALGADGVPMVTDLGLSHLIGEDQFSRAARRDPTMAAHCLAGDAALGGAIDVYSLAAVLFGYLTGRPFRGRSGGRSVDAVDHTAEALPPSVPPAVASVVTRGLRVGGARFDSIGSFTAELDGAAESSFGADWMAMTSLQVFTGHQIPDRSTPPATGPVMSTPSGAVRVVLRISPPRADPYVVTLENTQAFGRSAAGHRLADHEVSRTHFAISIDSSVVYLADLGSQNGTFLNGKLIDARVTLSVGDVIRAGDTELRVDQLGVR